MRHGAKETATTIGAIITSSARCAVRLRTKPSASHSCAIRLHVRCHNSPGVVADKRKIRTGSPAIAPTIPRFSTGGVHCGSASLEYVQCENGNLHRKHCAARVTCQRFKQAISVAQTQTHKKAGVQEFGGATASVQQVNGLMIMCTGSVVWKISTAISTAWVCYSNRKRIHQLTCPTSSTAVHPKASAT